MFEPRYLGCYREPDFLTALSGIDAIGTGDVCLRFLL